MTLFCRQSPLMKWSSLRAWTLPRLSVHHPLQNSTKCHTNYIKTERQVKFSEHPPVKGRERCTAGHYGKVTCQERSSLALRATRNWFYSPGPPYSLTSTSLPPLPGLPPSLTLTAVCCSWASSRLHRSSWCLHHPEGCSSGPARWGTAWWPWQWRGWHSSLRSGHSYPACRERRRAQCSEPWLQETLPTPRQQVWTSPARTRDPCEDGISDISRGWPVILPQRQLPSWWLLNTSKASLKHNSVWLRAQKEPTEVIPNFTNHASSSLITILEICNHLSKEGHWGLSNDDQVALSGQKTHLWTDLQVLLLSAMTHLLHSLTVNLGFRAQLWLLSNSMERTSTGLWASHSPVLGPAGKGTGSWGRQIPPHSWTCCSSWLPAPSSEAGPALVLAPIRTMEIEDKE